MGLCCLIGFTVKLLSYAAILFLCAFGLLFLLLKNCKPIQEKWFSYVFLNFIVPNLRPLLVPFKDKLFSDLDKVVSKDPEMKKNNLFRMLEIGVGQGANLNYYPKNCRLISLEPNDSFQKYYEENKSKYPDLVVERFVKGTAENMKDIADETVDVVVCTHVLCSVDDMESVLKEVKRVLCKDGQFLFLEHVAAPVNTKANTIQHLLEPVWKVFFAGCRLTCVTQQKLNEAGFAKVEVENVDIPKLSPIIRCHIFGRALK